MCRMMVIKSATLRLVVLWLMVLASSLLVVEPASAGDPKPSRDSPNAVIARGELSSSSSRRAPRARMAGTVRAPVAAAADKAADAAVPEAADVN